MPSIAWHVRNWAPTIMSASYSRIEYVLLLILARRPGRELSRDDILNELRGIDAAILTRSVDIMTSRLRQKLGDTIKPARFIQTVWDRGHSFVRVPLADMCLGGTENCDQNRRVPDNFGASRA